MRSLGYDGISVFSTWLMIWAIPMIRNLLSDEPTLDSLPEIPKRLNHETGYKQLRKSWKREATKARPSFFRALMRVVWCEYAKSCLFIGYSFISAVLEVVVMGHIISFLKDDEASLWEGCVIALVYIAITVLSFLVQNRGFFLVMMLIGKMKNWVCAIVSEKLLRLKYQCFLSGTAGSHAMTIVGSDAEVFDLLIASTNMWIAPLFTIVVAYLLWINIGWPGLVGLGIVVAHFFLNIYLGRATMKIRSTLTKFSDSRVKMITNLLEGIKVVKLYAWEDPSLQLIYHERALEIQQFGRLGAIQVLSKTLSYGLTGVSIFLPLLLYVSAGYSLTLERALSALALLFLSNSLISYYAALSLRSFFLFIAACNHVTELLLLAEVSQCSQSLTPAGHIEMQNVYSSFIEGTDIPQKAVLKNISISASAGELLVIAGPVGCGKTACLLTILRELNVIAGEFNCKGSLSYCPDSPWVVSNTVQYNIILGQDFNEDRYNYAVYASALYKDLDLMPDSDQTLVGEQGATLSGGQKARLCLARALYADRSVLLLDDPLSAVDAAVGAEIFEQIKALRNSGKCIILATHHLHTLPYADKILVLNEGSQIFFGKYSELCRSPIVTSLLGEFTETKESAEEQTQPIQRRLQSQSTVMIETEERAKGNIPWRVYKKYFILGFGHWGVLIACLLLLVASQVIHISVYYWVERWASAEDQDAAIHVTGFGVIIGLLYLFGCMRFGIVHSGFLRANREIHNQAITGVTRTDASFFDRHPTGRILNRFTKDTAIADEPMLYYFIEFMHLGLMLFGTFILFFIVSPVSLVAFLLFLALMILVCKKVLPLSKTLRKLELISRSPLMTALGQICNGIATIRCLDLQSTLHRDVEVAADSNMRAFVCYHSVLRYMQMLIDSGALTVKIMIVLSFLFVRGLAEPGTAGMALALSASLANVANFWAKTMVEVDNYMASPQRLLEYSKLPSEWEPKQSVAFRITKGHIFFDRVNMKYQKHLPLVLKEFTLDIPESSRTGIVGRTGAGKSSIMQALFRIVKPATGTIFIDGQDYLTAKLEELRPQLSAIPQTPFLFKASVRENLDPYRQASDKEIEDVLKQVRLLPFVKRLSHGIETSIVSSEVNLSAGEKQLVCLARALLRMNKIVIMDEATANVDHETDKFIQEVIRTQFASSTVLIVAHRLRTIIDCDQIVVMDEGTCAECGPPAVLASDPNSLFAQLILSTGPEESKFIFNKLT